MIWENFYYRNYTGEQMKKNVWIFNHYATNMFFNQSGRHYWLAKYLQKKDYIPMVFCASTIHNSDKDINLNGKPYAVKETSDDFKFVFVKASKYKGNGLSRVKNMFSFAVNLYKDGKMIAKEYGKPDIIFASSVHPLTIVAGIYLAKFFNVKCIGEVRDLWPESIVAYGIIGRNSIIAKALYLGERWIYKKVDKLIFTWDGAKDYLAENHFEKQVIKKSYNINNGVVIKTFNDNANKFIIVDNDLDNKKICKIVYTGSIRLVNNLKFLVDLAQNLNKCKCLNVKIIIYGDGPEKDKLIEHCNKNKLDNIVFKGSVEKKYIPGILKRADINILHNTSTILDKYGQSQNKLFEYLAAGKPILQTYNTGHSIIDNNKCGICLKNQSVEEATDAIMKLINNKELRQLYGSNARITAGKYDFAKLTDDLIKIIEDPM